MSLRLRPSGAAQAAGLAVLLLTVATVSAGWISSAGTSKQQRPTRAEIVTKLPQALSGARMRADLLAFERIADRSGGNRAAGTAGYRASVAHVRAELKRAGYTPRSSGFPFVLYREIVERGAQVAPIRRELRWRRSTTRRRLRRAVSARASSPPTTAASPPTSIGVRGRVALARRGACFFAVKARIAVSSGAIALVVYNSEPGPLTPRSVTRRRLRSRLRASMALPAELADAGARSSSSSW